MIHYIGCHNLSKLKEMEWGLDSTENVSRGQKLYLKSLTNLGRGHMLFKFTI